MYTFNNNTKIENKNYRGVTHTTIQKPSRKQIQPLISLEQLKITEIYLSDSHLNI